MIHTNFLKKEVWLFIAGLFFMASCNTSEKPLTAKVETLSTGWKMQTSEKMAGTDESSVSLNEFNDADWLDAIVPGTVLGSMATTRYIEDPYFGINMQKVDPEQFKNPWWFRTSFNIEAADLEKVISLRFNGINYRADLWVNGKKVEGKENFAGTYLMFTFNIN